MIYFAFIRDIFMKFYIFSTSRIYDTFQLQQMKCVVNWWKSLFRVTTIEFQFNIYIYINPHTN